MMEVPPKTIRFLADEFHSESWSVSAVRAREIAPENPENSSYQKAADALAARDFTVIRNTAAPISAGLLNGADVLALVHPCDPRWESTTSTNAPALSVHEIEGILAWVRAGGGLLVVSEYEHDKYGDNLNELLAPAGLRIEGGKVFDKSDCAAGNAEWIFAMPMDESPLGHLARRACFFRAGWLTCARDARVAWRASARAHPASAAVVGCTAFGEGRIVVVTDSVVFGDEHIGEHDHLQLWLNIVHWLAAPAYARQAAGGDAIPLLENSNWLRLRGIVNTLRAVQRPDGGVEMPSHDGATKLVSAIVGELAILGPRFPHQADYFAQLSRDLEAWAAESFGRPDFSASLALFRPELDRSDGIQHLVLFPMYTPNASSDTRFEALITQTFWPPWLAEFERQFVNSKFVPIRLLDSTVGYASECAVLFPETVSAAAKGTNHFGGIFCDREASRLQDTSLRAAAATGLAVFPELECLLNSHSLLVSVCALWDLIHDKSHSRGELPFDPFMIRQRSPFWMYGIEELRVDVEAFCEAERLSRSGCPFARYVCWAIVLDRIFRFPITGSRVRNYDALGGQILFSALHQRDVVVWRDNRLAIRWDLLPSAISALRDELHALYKSGAACSKVSFWIAAHDWVARYVKPNVGSRWRRDALADESDPKVWLGLAHEDEFPLGSFHVNLLRKLRA
jgi:Family of unknown function (DUF6421)